MPARSADATLARASSSHGDAAPGRASASGVAAPRRSHLLAPADVDVDDGQQIHQSPSRVTLNKNVTFLQSSGFWVWYGGLVLAAWLALAAVLDDPGLAWTYTHLLHGVLTYYLFHVTKGTPFMEDASDHGRYRSLTFWEQVDDQQYGTRNRKMLAIVPVVLFLLATHGTDFTKQPLGLNLAVVLVLLVAKLPALHRVRIFGINKY